MNTVEEEQIMIRNETEYQQALDDIHTERNRFGEHAKAWAKLGYTGEQIAKLMEPLESYHAELVEDVSNYERLKRGEFRKFENLQGFGQVLIGARIARGMTRRELASSLNIDESQVSRDERNEYHGITVERARKILDALGVRLVTRVEAEPIRTAIQAKAVPEPELASR